MKRRVLYIASALVGLLVALILVAAAIWPVINEVETGKTPEYPEVVPQYYSADPMRVFNEVQEGVASLERWELVSADPKTGTVVATRTTRLGFVDDIELHVFPVTEFATQVDAKSASRVGRGDLGQNARNIKAFFAELDQRLGAVKFEPDSATADKAQPVEK